MYSGPINVSHYNLCQKKVPNTFCLIYSTQFTRYRPSPKNTFKKHKSAKSL